MKRVKNMLTMMMVLALTLCPLLAGAEGDVVAVAPVEIVETMGISETGAPAGITEGMEIVDEEIPMGAAPDGAYYSNEFTLGATLGSTAGMDGGVAEEGDGLPPDLSPEAPVFNPEITPEPVRYGAADVEFLLPRIAQFGDPLTMQGTLIDYDGEHAELQWQYNYGEGWRNAPGESTGLTYTTTLSEETVHATWRLQVVIAG